MTFTYTATSLNGTGMTPTMFKARLMIGDTVATRTDFQLLDEEYYMIYQSETSPTLVAAAGADLLAAKAAFMCNTENGALRISAAARMAHYNSLADRLRAGGAGDIPGDAKIINATMYVGGSSVAAKNTIFGDSDTVQPDFKLGMDDMPGVTTSASV